MIKPPPRSLAWLAVLAALTATTPASAQLLGGGGLPALPGVSTANIPVRTPDLPRVDRTLGAVDEVARAPLAQVRRLAAARLLRDNPRLLEADDRGAPVVRGEVLALAPTAEALARAQAAGFQVASRDELEGLGVRLVVLRAPPGLSAVAAVRRLRNLDRAGQYDFNHIYQPGGVVSSGSILAAAAGGPSGAGLRIGLVDGGVPEGHPALAGVSLVQRGFAGPVRPSPHAVAVASLLAGRAGAFRGAAPGASLMVADVYGGAPTGGSAASLARAFAWMAQERVAVVNVSLVGPPNLTLAAATQALVARGHLVVAAVGNDGPAAAPLFPAAYPGVVAVTAVDGRRRLLPEAGRGSHVDFTAPGSDMAAAGPGGGFVAVRGTSFAAPLAAGRLAALLPAPDRAAAIQALAALGREATDLGARGPDRVYGRGLVAFDLRVAPAAVAARGGVLRGP